MADIHIRVPADTAQLLKERAKKKKMSVSKLASKVLEDYAVNPKIRNLDDKYKLLVEDVTSLYQSDRETTYRIIEENNYLLTKLIDILEKEG